MTGRNAAGTGIACNGGHDLSAEHDHRSGNRRAGKRERRQQLRPAGGRRDQPADAGEGNGIVDAIYGITEPFVAPFRGIFSIDQIRPVGRSVFDVAAVIAIVGWLLVAVLINAILRIPDRSAV